MPERGYHAVRWRTINRVITIRMLVSTQRACQRYSMAHAAHFARWRYDGHFFKDVGSSIREYFQPATVNTVIVRDENVSYVQSSTTFPD